MIKVTNYSPNKSLPPDISSIESKPTKLCFRNVYKPSASIWDFTVSQFPRPYKGIG